LTNGIEVTTYIRRRSQPSGALDCADPWRPREGFAGVRYHVIRGTLDSVGVAGRKQGGRSMGETAK